MPLIEVSSKIILQMLRELKPVTRWFYLPATFVFAAETSAENPGCFAGQVLFVGGHQW